MQGCHTEIIRVVTFLEELQTKTQLGMMKRIDALNIQVPSDLRYELNSCTESAEYSFHFHRFHLSANCRAYLRLKM
jgi:hypothetical protein